MSENEILDEIDKLRRDNGWKPRRRMSNNKSGQENVDKQVYSLNNDLGSQWPLLLFSPSIHYPPFLMCLQWDFFVQYTNDLIFSFIDI